MRTFSDRFPNPLAVIISEFRNGALIVLGIFAARDAMVNAKVWAGPPDVLCTTNEKNSNDASIIRHQLIFKVSNFPMLLCNVSYPEKERTKRCLI